MALEKFLNSNVTVEEANAYFEDRLGGDAWFELEPQKSSQALITATTILGEMNWIGVAESESQKSTFPRLGSYFEPRLGIVVSMDGIPSRISAATCELAWHLIKNEEDLEETGGVGSIEVSGIVLNDMKKPPRIPIMVSSLIKPLLVNAGMNNWWRAN
jgi:hypothetical protein